LSLHRFNSLRKRDCATAAVPKPSTILTVAAITLGCKSSLFNNLMLQVMQISFLGSTRSNARVGHVLHTDHLQLDQGTCRGQYCRNENNSDHTSSAHFAARSGAAKLTVWTWA
jgi:hypothetical protein